MVNKSIKVAVMALIFFLLAAASGLAQDQSVLYRASPLGRDLRQGLTLKDIQGHWAREAIIRQVALGILSSGSNQRFEPDRKISRRQTLEALLRLQGLDGRIVGPGAGEIPAYLAVALQTALITPREMEELSWDDGVRRQEAAAWIARILGLPRRESLHFLRNFQDWPQVEGYYLQEVEALLAAGHLQGVSPGVLAPEREMTRGELASLMDRVGGSLYPGLGISTSGARYIDSSTRTSHLGGESREDTYRFVTDRGELVSIMASESGSQGVAARPLVVARNGFVGAGNLLRPGDQVRYYLFQGEVFFLEVLAAGEQKWSGRIENINAADGWLDFVTLQGERKRFPLDKDAEITINGIPTGAGQLFAGQEAQVECRDDRVYRLLTYLPEGDGDGEPTPASLAREGKIRYIQGSTIVILTNNGTEERYRLTESTNILRGGTNVAARELRAGDQVLFAPSPFAAYSLEQVVVAGGSQLVREIYRGNIGTVSTAERKLTLNSPARFNMVKWEAVSEPLILTLQPPGEIYGARGERLTLQDLARAYRGKEIYVVTGGGFGKEEALRVVVKEGFANEHYGRLDHIDWVAGDMEMGRQYMVYNAGTIFLWDDRLIDPYALEQGQEVLTLTESSGRGAQRALLVSVEDVQEPVWDIYRGVLTNLGYSQVQLRRISKLSGNRWRDWSTRTRQQWSFNQESTFWYNLSSPGLGPLSKSQFDRLRMEEGSPEGSEVILVSKNDEVVALGLWPRGVDNNRVTVGRVTEIDRGRESITIGRIKDWQPALGEWGFYPEELEIRAGEAVVVHNDRGLDWRELRPGDHVYLLREGTKGILILINSRR